MGNHLCRAVDKVGETLDFTLSKGRTKPVATKFLAPALEVNGPPGKIVIDRSGVNMIRNGQMTPGLRPFAQFVAPAA